MLASVDFFCAIQDHMLKTLAITLLSAPNAGVGINITDFLLFL